MQILLAADASSHSQAAAKYLIAMPFRKPVHLDIACALIPPFYIESGFANMPADLSSFLAEECRGIKSHLDDIADVFSESASEKWLHKIQTHVPIGPPATELLSLADQSDADLVVLGAVGHSALRRVLLGSVSDYVATHADVSTLVVRPRRDSSLPPELNKLVIALSGSPEDQRMLDWLRQLCLQPSVEVHLVRIMQNQNHYQQDIRESMGEAWEAFERQAQQQILDYETQLQAMNLNTETHLVQADHIGEALIDYSETHGCDLIITGDSDSGLLTRMFLGSTSRYVLRHATCSILIVRDKKDHLKAKQEAIADQNAGQIAGQIADPDAA